MTSYALRRLAYAIPTLLGVIALTFIVFHVAGGDPILQLAGKNASAERIAELREFYGFNLPLYQQFFRYLGEVLTLNFERSFQTNQTIGTMLKDGVFASLALSIPAFILSLMLSVALALFAAAFRNSFLDRMIVVLSVIGMSVSILAYILLGQYFFAYQWNWFPISGFEPIFPEVLHFLALPWLIWILVSIGTDVRFFRTVFLEEMSKDYVRTARAKGVSLVQILFVHVLRNAMVQILTRVVIAIPFLFTGSLLIENFFGIPGLGSLMITAFNSADWPVIKAMTLIGSILYILFQLLSDLLCAALDPRVELE